MKKVIVTGATGFLGQNLVKKLISESYEVIALGRNTEKGNSLSKLGAHFYSIDLCDIENLSEIFCNTDFVVHCAAKSSPWGGYKEFFETNVQGTQNVINLCLKNSVKRLIYISSPSIYNAFKNQLELTEETKIPLKQINNYSKTKLMAERLIDKAYKAGLDVITLRPRAIFGEDDSSIFPRLIELNCKKFIPILSNDDILIDITHVDNVVEAIMLSLNAPKECSGQKYNITNGEHCFLHKTVKKIITELGYEYKARQIPYFIMYLYTYIVSFIYKIFLPQKEPPIVPYTLGILSYSQTFDITKAKKELKYKPIISIEEGLREVICNYEVSNGKTQI